MMSPGTAKYGALGALSDWFHSCLLACCVLHCTAVACLERAAGGGGGAQRRHGAVVAPRDGDSEAEAAG